MVVHTISNPGRHDTAGGGVGIVRVGGVDPSGGKKHTCPVPPEITRVSRKGQIVIPKTIRDALKLVMGDPLAVTCTKEGLLVLKKIKTPFEREELQDLAAIEEAWGRIKKGEGKKATVGEFLKGLEEW